MIPGEAAIRAAEQLRAVIVAEGGKLSNGLVARRFVRREMNSAAAACFADAERSAHGTSARGVIRSGRSCRSGETRSKAEERWSAS